MANPQYKKLSFIRCHLMKPCFWKALPKLWKMVSSSNCHNIACKYADWPNISFYIHLQTWNSFWNCFRSCLQTLIHIRYFQQFICTVPGTKIIYIIYNMNGTYIIRPFSWYFYLTSIFVCRFGTFQDRLTSLIQLSILNWYLETVGL